MVFSMKAKASETPLGCLLFQINYLNEYIDAFIATFACIGCKPAE